MNFIIDILILALFVFLALIGIKKGLIKSAFELVGAFLAVYLASYFSTILSEMIYNDVFRPGVYEKMLETTKNLSVESAAKNFFDSLEPFVLEFFKWLECEVEYVNKCAFLHLVYTGLCDKV